MHSQYLGMGTGMKIAFPTFGNGNETLVFPGMVGNGNGVTFKIQSKFEFCPKTERGQIQSTIFFKVIYSTLQISKNYVIGPQKILFRNNVLILVLVPNW